MKQGADCAALELQHATAGHPTFRVKALIVDDDGPTNSDGEPYISWKRDELYMAMLAVFSKQYNFDLQQLDIEQIDENGNVINSFTLGNTKVLRRETPVRDETNQTANQNRRINDVP